MTACFEDVGTCDYRISFTLPQQKLGLFWVTCQMAPQDASNATSSRCKLGSSASYLL